MEVGQVAVYGGVPLDGEAGAQVAVYGGVPLDGEAGAPRVVGIVQSSSIPPRHGGYRNPEIPTAPAGTRPSQG